MSDLLAILGILVSLVGIPLTWILARRGRQRPDLRYVTDFDVLINPEDGLLARGLQMHFEDREIVRVSRTLVALWNKRGDPVKGLDVVPDDPLRLQLSGGDTALQARVVSKSRPQTKVQCLLDSKQPGRIILDFDFLDAGDGAVVEVLHQGAERPTIAGTVRGVNLKDDGLAELTHPALDAVAKSYFRRIKPWRSRGSLFTACVLSVQCCALIGALGYGLWKFTFRNLNPISTRDYQLDTINGQIKFAEKVRAVQALDWSPLSLVLAAILTVLFSFITYNVWRRQVHAAIPRSIVKIRTPTVQSALSNEPDSVQAQQKEEQAVTVVDV